MKKLLVLFTLACLMLVAVACGGQPQIVDVTRMVERVVTEEVIIEREVVAEGEAIVVTEVVIAEKAVIVESEVESYDDVGDSANFSAPAARPILLESRTEPGTMIFDDVDANPFVDTLDDSLSTFAIDVDTGSYTLMRSYFSDNGSAPPPDSVRVEEYVNFFDYDYPTPEQDAFAIHIEGAPAPYGESDAYHLVRVGIQGYEVPADERPDALLIFVIDVSGSMNQDNRLGLVKESLRLLVDALQPTDRVGIVVYGSNARTVLEPTSVDSERAIMQAIDGLQTEGATNAEEGIRQAYAMANRYRLDGQMTRLIVLSDGVANVGNTTADSILENARRGVSLSTFGFGMGNYNDTLMEQLANDGDGTYSYIDTLREAQRVFVHDLTGTLLTIAKDAKIQVEFNSEVVRQYRLIGYENRAIADEQFRDDTVDAGEIGAGHSVTALYEVRLEADAPANEDAMTVRVRFEEPDSAEIIEISQSTTSADFATSFAATSDSFQLAAVVAEFAELMGDRYWAREGNLEQVWQDADRVARGYRDYTDVQEFTDLVESAVSYNR